MSRDNVRETLMGIGIVLATMILLAAFGLAQLPDSWRGGDVPAAQASDGDCADG